MQRKYINDLELLRFGSRVTRLKYLLHNLETRIALYQSLAAHNASRRGARHVVDRALETVILPKISFHQDQINRGSPTCAICFKEFLCGEYVKQLPRCRHFYHSKGILKWLSKNSCPISREPTNESEDLK
jgi:hypothetical protein